MRESTKDRNIVLDIAKGIGIITVVIAHLQYTCLSKYIYWFHMPLFFIISGYLFKKPKSEDKTKSILVSKTLKYLIPYISYYFAILIIIGIDSNKWPLVTLEDIKNLIAGGVHLEGVFGPFWFITVLYFTQILFWICSKYMKLKMVTVITIICYVLSHLTVFQQTCIWDINTTLYALPLFYIGYKSRQFKWDKKETKILSIVASTIVLVAIILSLVGVLPYQLDIKHSMYTHFLLDLLIPTSFTLLIILISKLLVSNVIGKILAYLVQETLVIMYLHIPISYFLLQHFEFGNIFVIRVVLSIVIPVIISKLFIKNFRVMKLFFLGT